MFDHLASYVQSHKQYVDVAHALSSIVNLLGWSLGMALLLTAWRRNTITGVSVGPINIRMREAAVEATAAATRDWKANVPDQKVDVPLIRKTVARAFRPDISDHLIGKSILWVDDNPANNRLAVRALEKLQLDVEQALSTEAGLAAMKQRHFDLVISDMGRGTNMRAGYDLLKAIREQGNQIPFLIFAGSDSASFRQEAAKLGAQLSTNDMIELIDCVIDQLGK